MASIMYSAQIGQTSLEPVVFSFAEESTEGPLAERFFALGMFDGILSNGFRLRHLNNYLLV